MIRLSDLSPPSRSDMPAPRPYLLPGVGKAADLQSILWNICKNPEVQESLLSRAEVTRGKLGSDYLAGKVWNLLIRGVDTGQHYYRVPSPSPSHRTHRPFVALPRPAPAHAAPAQAPLARPAALEREEKEAALEVLGLSKDAKFSQGDLDEAYESLARTHVFETDGAGAGFKAVQDAYERLTGDADAYAAERKAEPPLPDGAVPERKADEIENKLG
jgi:hypothetical protein